MADAKKVPHLRWLDIDGKGLDSMVAIVKEDAVTGDIYFINLNHIDNIDRKRLFTILRKRTAEQFPLWDLMSQTTLGNGMNALEYFHQMVKVKTKNGNIINPGFGIRGGEVASPEAFVRKTAK